MINKYICTLCKKRIVCTWCATIDKKFNEESKSAYNMTITIDNCEQFESKEDDD